MRHRFSAIHRAEIYVLRRAREKAGISQRTLSQALKRVHNYAVLVETGQRMITHAEFIVYALAIGADPAELTGKIVRRATRKRKPKQVSPGETGQ